MKKYIYYLMESTDGIGWREVAMAVNDTGVLNDTQRNLMKENARNGIERSYMITRKEFY